MSTTATTNYSLVKENDDEPVLTYHRTRTNSNLDAIDAAMAGIRSDVGAGAYLTTETTQGGDTLLTLVYTLTEEE